MTAYSPDELEQIGIKDMIVGEIGYTLPWAMYARSDGKLFINGHYMFDAEPHGTCHMRIRREAHTVVVYKNTLKDFKYGKGYSSLWTEDDLPVDLVEEE